MTYKEAAQIIFNHWWMSQTWDMENDPPPPLEIYGESTFDIAMKMAYNVLMEKEKERVKVFGEGEGLELVWGYTSGTTTKGDLIQEMAFPTLKPEERATKEAALMQEHVSIVMRSLVKGTERRLGVKEWGKRTPGLREEDLSEAIEMVGQHGITMRDKNKTESIVVVNTPV